jgi:hypothetical protein
MTKYWRLLSAVVIAAGAAGVVLHGQGRGGGAWATTAGDAQRTSSVRTDPKISVQSMQKPGFQFLWKRKLGTQAQSLTQPILLPNIIAYKGFKALAFVGGSADNVYSIDYDLNRMFWEQHLATGSTTAGTAACPGGLTAITKTTAATPPPPGGRGRGGPGGGRGQGGPAIAGGRGGGDNVFAISSGGMVHVMNPQIGTDQIPPVKFVPANARVVGSILVDNVLYAATTGKCGGAANGVWAVDLISDAKPVVTWDSQGAAIAGAVAPTFGTDSTIYVATGGGGSPVSNAVVSLEPKTLKQKDWFSAGATAFSSAPVAFQRRPPSPDAPAGEARDLIVAAGKDGRLYVLDSAALGGADHKTPLSRSSQFSSQAADTTGLATWLDAAGTRWIAAASNGPVHSDTKFGMSNGAVTNGAVVAFTLVEQNGVPTLQPQWTSRDLAAAVTPVVVNGVVFALASGELTGSGATTAAQRAQRSSPAVLYALDGTTGKELWTSGNSITSYVPGTGPSAGDSQVYVVTADGTLYAFGVPMER